MTKRRLRRTSKSRTWQPTRLDRYTILDGKRKPLGEQVPAEGCGPMRRFPLGHLPLQMEKRPVMRYLQQGVLGSALGEAVAPQATSHCRWGSAS